MSVATKKDERELEKDIERLAYATTKVLAKEALIYDMDDALDALRRLWRDGVLQKYIDKIPELQELIRLGKLP